MVMDGGGLPVVMFMETNVATNPNAKPERTRIMARKRKVTPAVIESMKMLHDQGVKVSMIADVLKFSKWTVYQAKNAEWNLSKYIKKTRAHFDFQKKEVKDTSIVLSANSRLNGEDSTTISNDIVALAYLEHLTKSGFLDTIKTLNTINRGINEINRNLGRIELIFKHIDDELTGEVNPSPVEDESLTI